MVWGGDLSCLVGGEGCRVGERRHATGSDWRSEIVNEVVEDHSIVEGRRLSEGLLS